MHHFKLGLLFAVGQLKPPAWAENAMHYCGKHDGLTCEGRGGVIVGEVLHRYYR
jgi:hypothetical protein